MIQTSMKYPSYRKWRPARQLTQTQVENITALSQYHRKFCWGNELWEVKFFAAFGQLASALIQEQHTLVLRATWQNHPLTIVLPETLCRFLEKDRQPNTHAMDLWTSTFPWPVGLQLASIQSLLKSVRRCLWPQVRLDNLQRLAANDTQASISTPYQTILQCGLTRHNRNNVANNQQFIVEIQAADCVWQAWAALVRQHPCDDQLPWISSFPLKGRVLLAGMSLSLQDMANLALGDVLLPITYNAQQYFVEIDTRGFGFWVIQKKSSTRHMLTFEVKTGEWLQAGRKYAMNDVKQNHLHDQEIENTPDVVHSMDEEAPPCKSLEDVDITLQFLLGHLSMTVKDLQNLSPGAIFRMASSDGIVQILSGGRRVGRGVLVDVDGELGVQLTEIMSMSI